MKVADYDPRNDIHDLSGKVIIITGGTSGIGLESVLALAQHNPAHIYFTGRNKTSADNVISRAKAQNPEAAVTFIECDQASLASVQAAVERFKSLSSRLDILICNAGIMALPPDVTKDGYELQFGTNHLAHALLIKLLLPLLTKIAEQPDGDARVVSVSSEAHLVPASGGIDFSALHSKQDLGMFGPWNRYGQSKLANILYARQLAVHHPNILSVSLHPGGTSTPLASHMAFPNRMLIHTFHPFGFMFLSPPQGAYNQLWAATAPREQIVPGEYYVPVGESGRRSALSKDDKLAAELWEWTDKELEKYQA